MYRHVSLGGLVVEQGAKDWAIGVDALARTFGHLCAKRFTHAMRLGDALVDVVEAKRGGLIHAGDVAAAADSPDCVRTNFINARCRIRRTECVSERLWPANFVVFEKGSSSRPKIGSASVASMCP